MSNRTPKYRHHKPSGQAVVTLDGKDRYLGRFGSMESKAEYDRLIALWLAGGRRLNGGHDLTISELIRDYMEHADQYYRKAGEPTSEVKHLEHSFHQLRPLFGATLAKDFGPLALKAVRDAIIKTSVCRNVVNGRCRRIVRMFRWAVENEMVPGSVYHALQAVTGLRKGRCEVRESEPVKPVPEAFVEAILPHVSPPVAAILRLMRLTAMRPGEAARMRTCDIDTTGRVWVYTPNRHKTEHHGKTREVFLGPEAQEIVKPWLKTDLQAYLFSPKETMEGRWAEQRQQPHTRPAPLKPRPKRKPPKPKITRQWALRDFYRPDSLRVAVLNACLETGTPHWHPNQLRHNAATRLRREHGVDMARIILGHSDLKTTAIYAEADREKAMTIMARIG
jgi:integrase